MVNRQKLAELLMQDDEAGIETVIKHVVDAQSRAQVVLAESLMRQNAVTMERMERSLDKVMAFCNETMDRYMAANDAGQALHNYRRMVDDRRRRVRSVVDQNNKTSSSGPQPPVTSPPPHDDGDDDDEVQRVEDHEVLASAAPFGR